MEPFIYKELSQPNKIQKIFKKLPSVNIIEGLNNILADKSFDTLNKKDIEELCDKYNIDIQKKFKKEILSIIETYIKFHFNNPFPNEGTEFFPKFVEILGLTEKDILSTFSNIGPEIYQSRYEFMVSDRRLIDEEEAELNNLAEYLYLPDELTTKISADVRTTLVNSYFKEIVEDGEISPAEYQELNDLATNMNINLEFSGETEKKVEMLKQIWQINHEDLPICKPHINLQKNEVCFYYSPASWYEYKAVRGSTPYHGVTGRIKLGKGLYYRYGKINYQRESSQELRLIDTGEFFITNKRVIFTGTKGNKNIRYSKILGIVPYNNGVDISKDSGKNPFIEITDDVEIFTAILTRALNEETK